MANSTSTADPNGLYHYMPNKTAAIVAAGFFSVSALLHLFQMIRKKTWFYLPMTVGAFMMSAGYAARYLSAKSPNTKMLYIAQSLLILLPPSLYSATIYMIYGRIVLFVNAPSASIIRPTRVTKIFVTGDVLSFFSQAGGGGMMSSSSSASLGQKVILAGLFAQILSFGFFLVIALVFERRVMKSGLRYSIPKPGKHTWRTLFWVLVAAAVTIIERCVYRFVAFAQGQEGYLLRHEVFMFVGDAIPMFFVQAIFHVVHAGDVFPRGGIGNGEEEYIGLDDRS